MYTSIFKFPKTVNIFIRVFSKLCNIFIIMSLTYTRVITNVERFGINMFSRYYTYIYIYILTIY